MAWVTAMCLSKGLIEVEHADVRGSLFFFRAPGDRYDRFASMNDLHDTREAAAAHANRKRVRRIAALKKQIERLSALEF